MGVEEVEEGSRLTEGVPSAESSLDDGRRICGKKHTSRHPHTHPSLSLSLPACLCRSSTCIATLMDSFHDYLLSRHVISRFHSTKSSFINHCTTQYTAIGEWFYLLPPSSTVMPYIFTTCGISENRAINPKRRFSWTAFFFSFFYREREKKLLPWCQLLQYTCFSQVAQKQPPLPTKR